VQRVNGRAHPAIVLRILLRQARCDRFHFRPSLRKRDIWRQSRDHFEEMIAARGGFLRREGDRYPNLVAPLAERRQAHAARQHTNHGVGFVVQGDRPADDAWIAAKTPFPQALVEQNNFRSGLIFGLAPASQASHFNLSETLKEGGRDSGAGVRGKRLRSALVIAEVAVSVVLLIGAGLLINSFMHLRNLDPGFRADHLLALSVNLSEVKYPDTARRTAFFDEVVRRVQPLPGVQSVAVAGNLPFTYNGDSMGIAVEGIPDPPPDQWPDVIYRAIGPGYFNTMGIPLVRGREFNDGDTLDTTRGVVIGEKTAKHYWPNQDPIGKRLKPGGTNDNETPWRTVIGVVKDVRQNDFIAEPKMQMYFSYKQVGQLVANALIVRTSVDPLSLAMPVRNVVWSVDKDQPVANIDSMENIVADAVARQRFSMLLLAIFAGLALVLAAVGIYGVMSYTVAQQTREIGIRIALGAKRRDVLRMTVKQALKLVGLGLLIGLPSAFILTRVMSSLLFGVSATDPITFVSISLVLTGVAMLASYIPALRATRVDPMVALRTQ